MSAKTIRVHHPEQLIWRKMGDIPMGWMRKHVDPTEPEGVLSFHEAGDATTMQLMEMRLDPHTLMAAHSHDEDEIYVIIAGSLNWEDKTLAAGGSLCVRAVRWNRGTHCPNPVPAHQLSWHS